MTLKVTVTNDHDNREHLLSLDSPKNDREHERVAESDGPCDPRDRQVRPLVRTPLVRLGSSSQGQARGTIAGHDIICGLLSCWGWERLWLRGFGGMVEVCLELGKEHRMGDVVTSGGESRGGPRRPTLYMGYTLSSFLSLGSGTNFWVRWPVVPKGQPQRALHLPRQPGRA